jgi:hypothetical protein
MDLRPAVERLARGGSMVPIKEQLRPARRLTARPG